MRGAALRRVAASCRLSIVLVLAKDELKTDKKRSPCFSTCSKLVPTALRTVERRAKTIGFGVGKIELV